MIERPTAWPDGTPLGGTNGYSPEWQQWAKQCDARYIVARMREAKSKTARRAIFEQWQKTFPHVSEQEVRSIWAERAAA